MFTRIRLATLLPVCTAAFLGFAGHAQATGAGMTRKPAPAPAPGNLIPHDTCGQNAARRFVGLIITNRVRSDIERAAAHDRLRVIRPGAIITHDLRSDRLNLIVDEAGHLLAARCG